MECGEVGLDGVIDLAGDVSLQAADDVLFGESFGGSAGEVGPGGGAPAHAHNSDHVQGVVGGPVTGGVEAMAVGFAAAGRDGVGLEYRISSLTLPLPLISSVLVRTSVRGGRPRSLEWALAAGGQHGRMIHRVAAADLWCFAVSRS